MVSAMLIRITFKLNKRNRLAIANYYGETKPASYKDCKAEIKSIVSANLEMLRSDLKRK